MVDVFAEVQPSIDSRRTDADHEGKRSDAILAQVEPGLEQLGYAAETGKRAAQKISRPVLYGDNGRPQVTYEIDAFHDELGVAVEIYTARAKASPEHNRGGHFRIRDDKVYANGHVTLRRGGRMHHIGLGTEHTGQPVRMLIHDLDVTVINRDTGEILRELVIDPNKNYQPRGLPPGPKKGTPRRGGIKKGYRYGPQTIRKSRDTR